jgi:hypothetical protein
MRLFGAGFIEKEGLDLAVRRYILIQNSGVFFSSPKRVMSGVGVIAGVQNDASCAFKPL